MKLTRKVSVREVKRCYVISQFAKGAYAKGRKKTKLTNTELRSHLAHAKKHVMKLSIEEIDEIIGKEWKGFRLAAYNSCDWYIGTVSPREVGVWNTAGGLPVRWTNGTLAETSLKVKRGLALGKLKGTRAGKVIPNMLETNVDSLQREKYQFPIIFKGGVGTRGRLRLKRQMKGDIEDGCMRSIALTVSGHKILKAYIGIPKRNTLPPG